MLYTLAEVARPPPPPSVFFPDVESYPLTRRMLLIVETSSNKNSQLVAL